MLDIANDISLAIDAIRTDGGTQSRSELDSNKIDEYAQLMSGGTVFPSIIVFYDGSKYWLADGFHRYHAAVTNGALSINVKVRQGTRRDAVLYSMEANTRHGIPLPLSDRKKCAKALLDDEEWSRWSDREIARRCGLSHVTVWAMRPTDNVKNEQKHVNEPVERVESVEEARNLRVTNKDKQVTIECFFSETPKDGWEKLSNVEIARKCGVTEGTVRNYKKELLEPEQTEEPAPLDLTPMEVVEQTPPEPEPAQDTDELFDGPAVEDEPVQEAEHEAINNWPVENDKPELQMPVDSFDPDALPRIEPQAKAMPEIVKPTLSSEEIAAYHEALKERRQSKEDEREERRDTNRQLIATAKTIEETLTTAKFSTIVIDPPWSWEDEGDVSQFGRGDPTYGTMTIDELLALPVGKYADDDCHLYLWITNRSLPKGFRLMDAWGFRYVTCVTWKKPYFGMGNYFRGQTEHLLFGVKGSQMLKRKDVGTIFDAPRGPKGHSSKPVEAYSLIESCSPSPYLELFARSERPDWTSWGAEV